MTTRRTLLKLTGATLATAGLALSMPRALVAAVPGDARFVTVLLRGAMDGLGAVAPYGNPAYREIRGSLALAEPDNPGGLLDLDGRFGLHPALSTLHEWYGAKELLVLHATATPYRDRSHFDGQDLLENGLPRPGGGGDGWLNRVLGLMGGDGRRLGLAVGPSVPLVLRGPTRVASWAPQLLPDLHQDVLATLEDLYAKDQRLGPVFAEGIQARRLTAGEDGMDARSGLGRGPAAARAVASEVGRLLAMPDGMRVSVIELNGWDTHVGQGAAEGRLASNLAILDTTLSSLRTALGNAWKRTVVTVITEFGRTARPNGDGGTDHGTASVAFLAGGAVAGGRLLGEWPGLAAEKLYQARDLAPTTDLRALLKGALGQHLGLPPDALARVVFPESASVAALPELMRT